MKFLLPLIMSSLPFIVSAQEITLRYTNDQGQPSDPITIKKSTKTITLKDVKALKNFNISIKGLAAKEKMKFNDDADETIGMYAAGDNVKTFTAEAVLNNSVLKIVKVDEDGKETPFVTISVLEELPKASLDVISESIPLIGVANGPCMGCVYAGDAIVYDYSSNTLSYPAKKWWGGGAAKVGDPFSFTVVNINPFRDSVVISNETNDFNTDVPDLFAKAFFSPGSTQSKSLRSDSILSDVLALGEQVEKATLALEDADACRNICGAVQKLKDDAEAFFAKKYKFDKTKKDLVAFLSDELQHIPEAYKDRVQTIIREYRKFYSIKNYYTYNIPKVQNVDEYIFTLSVLPKSGLQSNVIVDHQPVNVHTVGGFKFDFSSGLFVTGLRDQHFNLNPDSTVIHNSYGGDSLVFNQRNQIVRQTEDKKVDFGVSALMHFYPRITPMVNLSLTLGAGLSIGPNPQIRYLGGGSLLLGRSGRLVITYGCAAGFVDVLADGYQNLQYVSLTDKTALTKKEFKTAGFWSFSFNIPLFKSKVNTQSDATSTSKDDSQQASASGTGGK